MTSRKMLIQLLIVSRLRWNKEQFSPKVGTGFGRSSRPRSDSDSLFVMFSEQWQLKITRQGSVSKPSDEIKSPYRSYLFLNIWYGTRHCCCCCWLSIMARDFFERPSFHWSINRKSSAVKGGKWLTTSAISEKMSSCIGHFRKCTDANMNRKIFPDPVANSMTK